MKKIKTYSLFYRPEDNSGSVHLQMEDGTTADIFTNSTTEADFLLNLLRHEDECFYDDTTKQISTGIDFVGGEGDELTPA